MTSQKAWAGTFLVLFLSSPVAANAQLPGLTTGQLVSGAPSTGANTSVGFPRSVEGDVEGDKERNIIHTVAGSYPAPISACRPISPTQLPLPWTASEISI